MVPPPVLRSPDQWAVAWREMAMEGAPLLGEVEGARLASGGVMRAFALLRCNGTLCLPARYRPLPAMTARRAHRSVAALSLADSHDACADPSARARPSMAGLDTRSLRKSPAIHGRTFHNSTTGEMAHALLDYGHPQRRPRRPRGRRQNHAVRSPAACRRRDPGGRHDRTRHHRVRFRSDGKGTRAFHRRRRSPASTMPRMATASTST